MLSPALVDILMKMPFFLNPLKIIIRELVRLERTSSLTYRS